MSKHRPTKEELDERVVVPLDPTQFIEGVLESQRRPRSERGSAKLRRLAPQIEPPRWPSRSRRSSSMISALSAGVACSHRAESLSNSCRMSDSRRANSSAVTGWLVATSTRPCTTTATCTETGHAAQQLSRSLALSRSGYSSGMEFAEAEAQVRRLSGEWVEAIRVRDQAARQVTGLAKIILGYVEIYPLLTEIVPFETPEDDPFEFDLEPEVPKGAEALLKIMHERPDYWFWVSELVDALRERGWLPDSDNPANAVRTACERLIVSEDSAVHKGRGTSGRVVYSYRPDFEPFDGVPGPVIDDLHELGIKPHFAA